MRPLIKPSLPVLLFGLFGAAAVVLTLLGADPANRQQAYDFQTFYYPAMLAFAAHPLEALPDYSAAPTPLYFMLQGTVLAVFGTEQPYVRAASVLLGLAVLVAVARFPQSSERRTMAVLALLLSPYFRGQVWHANGDVLTLLLLVWALHPRAAQGRFGPPALLAALTSVYVRQTYVFLPMYVYLRGVALQGWPWLRTTLISAVAMLPLVYLVLLWKGLVPPRFAAHASAGDLPASLGVGLTISALYLSPCAAVWCLRPSRLWLRVRRLPWAVHGLVVLAMAYYAAHPGAFDQIAGGGVLLSGLKAVQQVTGASPAMMLMPSIALATYLLALVMREDPWRNSLVVLATLMLSASPILYQRYFDPLIALLMLLHVRAAPLTWMQRHRRMWWCLVPGATVAVLAAVTH